MNIINLRKINGKSSLPRILALLIFFLNFFYWWTARTVDCGRRDHNGYCISSRRYDEFSIIQGDTTVTGNIRKSDRRYGKRYRSIDSSQDGIDSTGAESASRYPFLSSAPVNTVVPLGLPCWSNYSYLRDTLRFSEADAITHTLLSRSALPKYTGMNDRSSAFSSSSSASEATGFVYPVRSTDSIGTVCRYYPSGDEGGVQCCCEQRKYLGNTDSLRKEESVSRHNDPENNDNPTYRNTIETDSSGKFIVLSLTCLPRLIVVGEMKAGTSALFLTVVTGESSVNQPTKKSSNDRTLETRTEQQQQQQQQQEGKLTLLNKLMDDNRKVLPPSVANTLPHSLSNFRPPPPPPLVPPGANIPNIQNHNPMFTGSSLSRNTQGPPNAPPMPGWLPPPQGPGFAPNAVAFTAKLGPRAPSIDQDRRPSFVSLNLGDLSSKDLTFVGGSAKELNYFSIAVESSPVTNAFSTMPEIIDTVSLSSSFSPLLLEPKDIGLESVDKERVHNPWYYHPTIYDMLTILYPCELTKTEHNDKQENSHHCPKDPYEDDYENGFGITPSFRRRSLHVRWRLIIDSSPAYLNFPLAIFRALRMLPYSQFIVLVRNPVDRAYSEYQMALRSGVQLPPADQCFKESLNRLIDCSQLADSTPSLNTSLRELHTLRNRWNNLWSTDSMKNNKQKWPGTVDVTGPRAKFNDLYPNCWPKGGLDDIGRDALYRSLPLPHLQRLYTLLRTQSRYSIFPFDDRLKVLWTQNLKEISDNVLHSIEVWLGMTKRHRVSAKVQSNCAFRCNRDLEGLEALFSNKHMEEAMALGLNGGNSNRYQQLDSLVYQYWLDIFKPYDASLFDWLSNHPELILHPTVIDNKGNGGEKSS